MVNEILDVKVFRILKSGGTSCHPHILGKLAILAKGGAEENSN